jgi:hypothetical protein
MSHSNCSSSLDTDKLHKCIRKEKGIINVDADKYNLIKVTKVRGPSQKSMLEERMGKE